jgi:siroheme synthase
MTPSSPGRAFRSVPKPRNSRPSPRRGSLTAVGLGIAGPAHLTPSARAALRAADTVFFILADALTRAWLLELHPRAQDLGTAYGVGKSRADSYEEMVERLVAETRQGKRVCAAFYGHPGVFAYPPHEAIRRLRAEGYEATMLPGISAEDWLFADLGVDPSDTGCASYEATDFLLRRRRFDPTAALVLWQIGLVGVEDVRLAELWSADGLAVLVDELLETYPADHEVVVYEASTLPITPPKIVRVALARLSSAPVTAISTLFVPPLPDRDTDLEMARRLGLVD